MLDTVAQTLTRSIYLSWLYDIKFTEEHAAPRLLQVLHGSHGPECNRPIKVGEYGFFRRAWVPCPLEIQDAWQLLLSTMRSKKLVLISSNIDWIVEHSILARRAGVARVYLFVTLAHILREDENTLSTHSDWWVQV